MCWNSFILMSIPSFLQLKEDALIKFGIGLTLISLPRVFYDCLMYWTGAEPAEHFSCKKRPLYKEYQKKTRVFFPFEIPFFDHGRVPGWPNSKNIDDQLK